MKDEDSYVEEKTTELVKLLLGGLPSGLELADLKDFIRSIMSEVGRLTSDKPKVKRELVYDYVDSEWINYKEHNPESYDVKAMILDFLEKIGIKVEK